MLCRKNGELNSLKNEKWEEGSKCMAINPESFCILVPEKWFGI